MIWNNDRGCARMGPSRLHLSKCLTGKSAVHSRDENKEELDFSTCLSLPVGIWVWAAQ